MKTQSDTILDQYEGLPSAEQVGLQNSARVPFKSNLLLSLEQEERLVDHCMDRLDNLEKDAGRDVCSKSDWLDNQESGISGMETFMGKRETYERTYHNDVAWRKNLIGEIFEKSNFVAPVARRITRQMIARATNYFFGTDPWFAATPIGYNATNHSLAEKVDRFLHYKLQSVGSVHEKRTAIELAFVRGESVIKTIYKRKEDIYEVEAEVLIDVEGNPIMDSLGGYIYKHDRWADEILVDDITGEESLSGRMVLERDTDTIMPEAVLYQLMKIKDRNVLYDGPESRPVYFKDFLCPLDAPTIEEADCVIHLYDLPFMELADTYRRKGILSDGDSQDPEATIKAVEMLRELSVNDGRKKSLRVDRSNSEDENDAELNQNTDAETDPMMNCVECWVRFDANEDGIVENLMVLIDRETRLPIFYEYVANVTADGNRPFTVIRPTEVDGRWYGVGAMEMFSSAQSIIDLLVNRWNLSHSESGRVTFFNPSMTYEGDTDPNLRVNEGKTYTLKPGFKPEDALGVVPLYNIEHNHIREMFELFMQMAMNESGIQNANDANAAGLDQAKLATGIRNLEKSGMEMFAVYISSLEKGIEATVQRESLVVLSHLKQKEVFDFMEGQDTQLMEITPDEVRNLSVNVSILLSRYRNEQAIQQASAGISAVQAFYAQPYLQQIQTTTFYRMIVKALDLRVDPDAIITPIDLPPQAPASSVNPNQAAAATADPQPKAPAPNL